MQGSDVQSVANVRGRRCIKITLRQCYIGWSRSSNRWNLTYFFYYSCCLSYAKSLVVHILARLHLSAQKHARWQNSCFTR